MLAGMQLVVTCDTRENAVIVKDKLVAADFKTWFLNGDQIIVTLVNPSVPQSTQELANRIEEIAESFGAR